MAKSAIEELFEEAIQIGIKEGREERRKEKLLKGARILIIQACRSRFGSSNSQVEEALQAETNWEKLVDINCRVFSSSSWEEILKD